MQVEREREQNVMSAKLIIRVHLDDRVEVKVEGLSGFDRSKPKGQKVCDKITRKLEHDLGIVSQRRYHDDSVEEQPIELSQDDDVKLGGV
jgi:hypothetical protein